MTTWWDASVRYARLAAADVLRRGRALACRPEEARRVLAVVAAGWVVIVYAGYQPGMMSPDTYAHLLNGYQGAYGNWHPPINAWLVGAVAGRLAGSPWPIFLAQLVALSSGLAALARVTGRPPWASALLLAAALALPNVWGTAATVWKDVLMAAALLWALVLLRGRRPAAALACALLAVLLRHNAIFAVVPLVAYAAASVPALSVSRRRVAVATVALLAALAAAPRGVERLLHARNDWPLGSLLVFDLAGVYAERPDLFPGSVIERELPYAQLRRLYSPANGALLFWNPRERETLDFARLPANAAAIEAEWWRAVRAAPGAYARHRWRVFAGQLGLHREVVEPFWWDMWPNGWGLALPKAGLAWRALERIRFAARGSLVLRGWFWIAACALAFAAGWRVRRRDPLVAIVAASGLLYAFPYLLIGVSGDYRYLYWTTICALAGALLALRRDDRPASRRANRARTGAGEAVIIEG